MSKRNGDSLKYGKITIMKQSDMLKCKFAIMVPEHYRSDGSCKCNNAEHRKMMIREWEYTEKDFEDIELLEGE